MAMPEARITRPRRAAPARRFAVHKCAPDNSRTAKAGRTGDPAAGPGDPERAG